VLDSFEKAWRTQNHEKRKNVHTEIHDLLLELDRERKRGKFILALCSTYTLISLIVIAFVLSRGDVPFSEAWPLITAQVLATAVLAYLAPGRFFGREPSTASVREATVSALKTTNTEISSVKLVAVAISVMMILLAFAVVALSDSGKMDARSVSSFGAVVLMIATFNGCYLWLKWKRKLKPRRDRLSSIMRDLDSR
jgi:hypothetical protein